MADEQKAPAASKPIETAKTATAQPKPIAAFSPYKLIGSPGTPYNIDGTGFGDKRGKVFVGGREVPVTRWRDDSIKGTLPSDLAPGPVVIETAAGLITNAK